MIYFVVYTVGLLFFLYFGAKLNWPYVFDRRYHQVENGEVVVASVFWPCLVFFVAIGSVYACFSWIVDLGRGKKGT